MFGIESIVFELVGYVEFCKEVFGICRRRNGLRCGKRNVWFYVVEVLKGFNRGRGMFWENKE